ncbi:hypothetical protein 101136BS1_047 [Escherichia phage vB_EcoP-101136BS1]|nr:hypothetical protein 101136BS1_047 [Escherichia phage vB_EcoP-101136BS1]
MWTPTRPKVSKTLRLRRSLHLKINRQLAALCEPLASTWGKTMLPYLNSREGRHMCACLLWEDGQSNFKSFEDFKAHTYRMADEFDGEEYTIYDVSGQPVAYLYMLATASWHRPTPGLDLSIVAIRRDSQSSRKVLETVRHIIDEECKRWGLGWYSRIKHVSGSVDIVTTKCVSTNKEINRG